MIVDFTETDDGAEGSVTFPLFNRNIDLLVNGDVPYEYVVACSRALESLSGDLVDKLLLGTARYREAGRKQGFTGGDVQEPKDLLPHIEPSCLTVWPPEGNGVALSLELDCDWEDEHGMEWLIRDSEVVYVGPFQGESPWDDPANLPMNYAV